MSSGLVRHAIWFVPVDPADPEVGPQGDLGASNKTEPFVAGGADGSVHVIGTGTPEGTPKLYASNDHDPGKRATDKWNGTWEDVTGLFATAPVAPTGSAFSYLLEFPIKAEAFYFDYAYTAGAGAVRATWVTEIP